MGRIDKRFKYKTSPVCSEGAAVTGEKYRFTVLTPALIRMEYSEKGVFEDRATQVVTNRRFEVPKFTVRETEETLLIRTECIELQYHKKFPFDKSSLTARFYGKWGDITNQWRFKNTTVYSGGLTVRNYWGTRANLDEFGGEVPLEKGVMAPDFAVWDDSRSMILADDGWVDERPDGIEDMYLFAYNNRHHLECLHDFLELSGKIPMLPRYALGNWWSRYHKYDDKEYLAVIRKFREKGIPLTVACMDMDWHITKIDKKYGTGWTGYTWNKELFPDHRAFLKQLHDDGLEVMLNLHDREGIGPHEDGYSEMVKRLGAEDGEKINFDFTNPKYVEAYFDCMRHDREDEGVSFWWTDGFPENTGKLLKADIPWMMNHYNYIDTTRNGKRGMLLSRNCGMGGHRYGVGFSGDTYATWEMLDFLPYFTSNASNVGFGWWSHDIGGFMNGERDDEMMVRWTQFGVFSPITRLHSTNNPFMSKEPWNYNMMAEKAITDSLCLRHTLIPYIYTMNYHCYRDNITLIRPLWYYYPNHGKKNEYFFGDEMLVSPITSKANRVTQMGDTQVLLPPGLWFDFFSARRYTGDREYRVHRDIFNIPVFVKAGGIIPKTDFQNGNSIENPQKLIIDIFPGADNRFELYEDDGVSLAYEKGEGVITAMELLWSEKPVFTVDKPKGKLSLIPAKRDYELHFRKVSNCDSLRVTVNNVPVQFEKAYNGETLTVSVKKVTGRLEVSFESEVTVLKNNVAEEADKLLMSMQMSNTKKMYISSLLHNKGIQAVLAEISKDFYDEAFRSALSEILLADCEF